MLIINLTKTQVAVKIHYDQRLNLLPTIILVKSKRIAEVTIGIWYCLTMKNEKNDKNCQLPTGL